jgi:sulfonate transport system substrate-binding protein
MPRLPPVTIARLVAARANPGSSGNYYLVSKPDSDISSVEDLAGKKVAYPPGTGRHMIVAAQLDAAGLSLEDDVEGIELAGSEVAPTFASGSVAAIVLGTQWSNLGEPPVIDDGSGHNWGLALLVVRRDTLWRP